MRGFEIVIHVEMPRCFIYFIYANNTFEYALTGINMQIDLNLIKVIRNRVSQNAD